MKYTSCKDYFIYKGVIKLSWSGLDMRNMYKITGRKISYFFEETNKNLDKQISIDNEYSLWSEIFHFPFPRKKKKNDSEEREKNFQFEQNVRDFLNKEMGVEFLGSYLEDKKDMYPENQWFGGVPDGEEKEGDKVVSVLEIKRVTDLNNLSGVKVLSFLLQLSLYLRLSNINTGYLCLCKHSFRDWKNPQNITFNSPIKKLDFVPTSEKYFLNSKYIGINNFEYGWVNLEKWTNDDQLVLYKVQIKEEKFDYLMSKIKEWSEKYKDTSPEISEGELKKLKDRECFKDDRVQTKK